MSESEKGEQEKMPIDAATQEMKLTLDEVDNAEALEFNGPTVIHPIIAAKFQQLCAKIGPDSYDGLIKVVLRMLLVKLSIHIQDKHGHFYGMYWHNHWRNLTTHSIEEALRKLLPVNNTPNISGDPASDLINFYRSSLGGNADRACSLGSEGIL